MRPVTVIGAACGCGAPDPDCRRAPETLRACEAFHPAPGQPFAWDGILRPPPGAARHPLPAVRAVCQRLAERVKATLEQGGFPLVVGGDHSCAVGTWSGAHLALRPRGPLGLIWIDAHMDSHTFATTPSGMLHGMPLACLLGHGDPALTRLAAPEAKLDPAHVCLIGVRSFEAGEAKLLHDLGVRVFDMDEVRRRGLDAVFDDALARVTAGTAGFGVSLDLDALDPAEDAAAVGTPVPGGLGRGELLAALARLRGRADFIALELVEYSPHRDPDGATARLAGAIVEAVTPL